MVMSFMIIRRSVGFLGVSLPVVLALGIWAFSGCGWIEPSISNYYYTIMGNILVGVLCAVALFLFTYRGFDKWDNISSNIAGLFALGVAFFPMNISKTIDDADIFIKCDQGWRNAVHYTSAGVFLLTLAYISYCRFTKTHHGKKDEMTVKKKKRNVIYRVCAVFIFVSTAMIGVLKIAPGIACAISAFKPVFVLETIALWAFGLSWLTKGEFILSD